MIGQLQFIAKYDLMILVTSSWSLSREALTWCEPSHLYQRKPIVQGVKHVLVSLCISLIIELKIQSFCGMKYVFALQKDIIIKEEWSTNGR